MDDRAQWEREMLRVFLSEHDAPCPQCGHNLRRVEGERCPECGAGIVLGVLGEERRPAPGARLWDMVAAVAVAVSGGYFAIMAAMQVRWALQAGLAGSSVRGVRAYYFLSAGTDVVMFLVALGWCVAMWTMRSHVPRPVWAKPTSAAAGILLGTFVAYLLLHVVRAIVL